MNVLISNKNLSLRAEMTHMSVVFDIKSAEAANVFLNVTTLYSGLN